ncbi:hypothetical protein CK203_081883 [Vitis vinifera]|uniref:Uncharacterized protein n=1 Tax=Vitis vinifera TaxID=29760 RepID=A0A438EAG1_VITVI|nr:hypothetical protein CK203_081883 [Vitis vinifera]
MMPLLLSGRPYLLWGIQAGWGLVGYPLVTLLLCLGDPQTFDNNFGSHMEQLYKHLRDKNHRFMALDCLHRVVRFYLNVRSQNHPKNRVWDYLDSVTSQLLTFLRKGMLTQDQDSLSEAKVIGLRALLAIVMSPSNQHVGLEVFQGLDIGHYIPKVKAAIDSIIRSCHRTYSQALLTSSRTTIDAVTKEKSQGYLFRSVLKCIPYLIEEVGRSDKITEIIPQHGISIDPGVREEAVQMINWNMSAKMQSVTEPSKKSSMHHPIEAIEFRASEIDAVGLIFLSSVDSQIRHTALELLRCVRALRNDIRDSLYERFDNNLKNDAEPIFIIDVLEENGMILFRVAIGILGVHLI